MTTYSSYFLVNELLGELYLFGSSLDDEHLVVAVGRALVLVDFHVGA